jgi:hypothetical protein
MSDSRQKLFSSFGEILDFSFFLAILLFFPKHSGGIHHACDFFLLQARAEMDKFIEPIQQHPDKREGALPYYLLHKEGEHVYGTVLMFHGFAASTGQMARLAQYLFENGFNVYQPALCGHYYNDPTKYWPKVR